MEKNFSDLNFVVLVAALFGVLVVVHALSRLQRRMANRQLPSIKPTLSKETEPSFIRPGVSWIKLNDVETEEQMVN